MNTYVNILCQYSKEIRYHNMHQIVCSHCLTVVMLLNIVNNLAIQYGRRNNIRISGLNGDNNRQSSDETTKLIIKTIKDKTGLELSGRDIDVAHRRGKYREGKKDW